MLYTIFTDGASRGNPGPAAIGAIVYDTKKKVIFELSECIGKATNNVAEYTALIKALECCNTLHDFTQVKIYLDSQLVVRQLQGSYRVKEEHLKNLHSKVVQLLLEKRVSCEFVHVMREKNKIADALANKALDAC